MSKREIIEGMLDDLNIDYKWSGLCYWMEGDVTAHLGTIAALGGKWAGKRQAWYIRCEQQAF